MSGDVTDLDMSQRARDKAAKREQRRQQLEIRRQQVEIEVETQILETLYYHPRLTRGEIHQYLAEKDIRTTLQNVLRHVERLESEGRVTYMDAEKPCVRLYELASDTPTHG